ncbi:related to E3 ubiquitin ligase [Lecanosticta acicola]|uniref:HECT-type E3 ubiquitin transferase n=1 Tax=Lecanosticta acicola TaxID=111012 RepID=A0AAI9EC38_9PEZI|nr:related to E3 ubiquitin ligase [Lecanosticta acicola]
MHQSFTGTSRRPRNVNLSGRNTNPFAKSNGTTGGASGAQQAIASAQQDRLNRQIQRDRLQASSRIQKVWRGHRTRRRTFKLWREIWDKAEERPGAYQSAEDSLRQLWRLMLFFSPRTEPEDTKRLCWYGTKQITTTESVKCSGGEWPGAYSKLARACLAALKVRGQSETRKAENNDRLLLGILAFAARHIQFSTPEAISYYEVLTIARDLPAEPLQIALLAPLQSSREAYSGLVVLLARPLDPALLTLLHAAVDSKILAETAASLEDTSNSSRERLWLLGNLISLLGGTKDMTSTAAVARLLGSLADDVEFETQPLELDNETFDRDVLSKVPSGFPLNAFLHRQFVSLLDQNAIRNLLSGEFTGSHNARILAGYALTLLRCFPRRADEIRMWLHLGPTTGGASPISYLWNAAKVSNVFSEVKSSSRGVVSLLKTPKPSAQQRDDWAILLVFLEMFSFDLKIMDDEEFIGSNPRGKRNSAVPLADVAQLVTFLKNLGFTMYFDAAELNDAAPTPARDEGSIGRRFGSSSNAFAPTEIKPLTVAGLPGLTFDYLKGVVTGLLRAIYERDSRRNFLPKNHWLMTDRFDMQAFIPGVVAEEESRHQVQQQDDEDKDEESEDEDIGTVNGMARSSPSGYARVLRAQEARARAQRKASRKRYLASVAPRLEILQNMPFFIPFHTRVEIFRQFVYLDQTKRRNGTVDPDLWRQNMMFQPQSMHRDPLERHHAKIKRTQEFSDAYQQFYDLGADLKEPIQITFIDRWDQPEAGIDGGGVTKEFLNSVIGQAFDQAADYRQRFFVENDQHLLYPSPTAFEDLKIDVEKAGVEDGSSEMREYLRDLHKQYEFLGRIIGKCLYEGILVDVSFAGFFLKKWALTGGTGSAPNESHYRPNINDLRELDPRLYKGLLDLKNAENAEDIALSFTINDEVGPPGERRIVEVDLAPNGANTPVTNENRLSYINRVAAYRLQLQSKRQTTAFLRGLGDIIQPSWLSMFNQSELQTLIGGASAGIDVNDLRKNTQYGGVYVIGNDGQEHPSVQLFWQVMSKLPDEERRKVLKFVTSTPRGPLLGFSHLNPKFSIRDSGGDENRYPTTSTCVNLLKLPIYRSEKTLREKLLAAVNSGAGFDLS